MAAVAEREGALARVGGALPTVAPAQRREGPPSQLVFPHELALADFARHLSLSARRRTADAYLDVMQRLVAFEVDPLQAERGDLERFLSRNRRGGGGGTGGAPSPPTPPPGLARPPPSHPRAPPQGPPSDQPT